MERAITISQVKIIKNDFTESSDNFEKRVNEELAKLDLLPGDNPIIHTNLDARSGKQVITIQYKVSLIQPKLTHEALFNRETLMEAYRAYGQLEDSEYTPKGLVDFLLTLKK